MYVVLVCVATVYIEPDPSGSGFGPVNDEASDITSNKNTTGLIFQSSYYLNYTVFGMVGLSLQLGGEIKYQYM